MKRFVLIGLSMLCAGAAAAQEQCIVQAGVIWGMQDAPAIYAGPSTDAPLLGTAPRIMQDDTPMEAQFGIVEMRPGWARVTDVTSFDGAISGPDGWIDARFVSVAGRANKAFSQASETSAVVWSSDHPIARVSGQPLECRGKWVRIMPDTRTASDGVRHGGGDGTMWVQLP
jgi:hypothetical protein